MNSIPKEFTDQIYIEALNKEKMIINSLSSLTRKTYIYDGEISPCHLFFSCVESACDNLIDTALTKSKEDYGSISCPECQFKHGLEDIDLGLMYDPVTKRVFSYKYGQLNELKTKSAWEDKRQLKEDKENEDH